MNISSDLGIWIQALLTIGIFSYLYKENPLYRFVEHIFVGLSAGYILCITYYTTLEPKLKEMWELNIVLAIIPTILGLMIYTRFSKKYSWLSTYPIALIVGVGAGLQMPAIIASNVLEQIRATLGIDYSGGISMVVGGVILITGTIAGLIYFFFSMPHKGVLGKISRYGIVILMIGFGASFGYTVMARVFLFIGRVLFLMRDWLGMIT